MRLTVAAILGAHERGNGVRGPAMLGVGFALGLAALSTLNALVDRDTAYLESFSVGQIGGTRTALAGTAIAGSPGHLLLVVRGLEVAGIPGRLARWPAAAPGSQTPIKVELLLDTWILGERGERQTYRITSRLVSIDTGETIWSRAYAGELLSRGGIRLQLSRAVGDAIMYTRMADRSQLMVELKGSLSGSLIDECGRADG